MEARVDCILCNNFNIQIKTFTLLQIRNTLFLPEGPLNREKHFNFNFSFILIFCYHLNFFWWNLVEVLGNMNVWENSELSLAPSLRSFHKWRERREEPFRDSAFYSLSYLVLFTALWGKYYRIHLINKEISLEWWSN